MIKTLAFPLKIGFINLFQLKKIENWILAGYWTSEKDPP